MRWRRREGSRRARSTSECGGSRSEAPWGRTWLSSVEMNAARVAGPRPTGGGRSPARCSCRRRSTGSVGGRAVAEREVRHRCGPSRRRRAPILPCSGVGGTGPGRRTRSRWRRGALRYATRGVLGRIIINCVNWILLPSSPLRSSRFGSADVPCAVRIRPRPNVALVRGSGRAPRGGPQDQGVVRGRSAHKGRRRRTAGGINVVQIRRGTNRNVVRPTSRGAEDLRTNCFLPSS